ncbi:hypothetical protein CLOM_g6841 [Closterium sp. NIES-68]|nr:hypothetical protein CLOM_g6841 [Closterium sp. NIES-68]GJP72376.1 hypothetical protein CLOP_g3115 [Closterium sp. NIES-67]
MTSYLFSRFMSRRINVAKRVPAVQGAFAGGAAERVAPLQAAGAGNRCFNQPVAPASSLSSSSASPRRFSWLFPALVGALAGGATAAAALHSVHDAQAPSSPRLHRLPLSSALGARFGGPEPASPFHGPARSVPPYSRRATLPLGASPCSVQPIPRLALTSHASPSAIPSPVPESPPLSAAPPHGSLPAPRSVVEGIKRLLPGEAEPGGKAEGQGEGGEALGNGKGEREREGESGKEAGSGGRRAEGTVLGEEEAGRGKGDAGGDGDSGTCGRNCLSRHAIADAAARAAPAVVNLTVSVGRGMFSGQAMGSGAIIRADGLILTNAHVVAEMVDPTAASAPYWSSRAKLQVTLQDGRTFDGHVLSFDSLSDIALVKVSAPSPLPVVKLGSSKALRPGDWVVALGSPLHLSNTVTAGIVSCVDRKGTELGLRGGRMDYIQTDAAINAGNSGGPLVNLDGEVVGINNMKALAADGVSFAIPIDSAVHILDQLSRHGRVVRPFVGIKMLELNASIIEQLRDRDPSFPAVTAGILVPQVIPGSPAAKGGLQPGDVIVEFAGQPVASSRQVLDLLGDKVGAKMPVVVRRAHGKTVTLSIVTEEATPDM